MVYFMTLSVGQATMYQMTGWKAIKSAALVK